MGTWTTRSKTPTEKLKIAETGAPITCETCVYMATHEKCDDNGGCTWTKDDYAAMRNGENPPMRFQNWVEATGGPVEQMERLHALQLKGDRNIVLGPGEAEVSTKDTPQETSKHLHYVAEQCGYMCGNLAGTKDGGTHLVIWKDFGPFDIIWNAAGELVRIDAGEEDKKSVFWNR